MRSQSQGGAIDLDALNAAYAAMEQEGRARLGGFAGEVVVSRAADMRYGEQVFEIAVPLDHIDWSGDHVADAITAAFHARHRALYTYALEGQEAVLVNARLSVIGKLPPSGHETSQPTSHAPTTNRRIWLDGWTDAPVYDFSRLSDGETLAGPAIISAETTTVLLRPRDTASFDARGWLHMKIAQS
jgi:N-methylhydantoinase A